MNPYFVRTKTYGEGNLGDARFWRLCFSNWSCYYASPLLLIGGALEVNSQLPKKFLESLLLRIWGRKEKYFHSISSLRRLYHPLSLAVWPSFNLDRDYVSMCSLLWYIGELCFLPLYGIVGYGKSSGNAYTFSILWNFFFVCAFKRLKT